MNDSDVSGQPELPNAALVKQFKAKIESASFPCVGAKAALHRSQLDIRINDDLRAPPHTETVRALQQFSQEYRPDSPLFQSFIIVFRNPRSSTERSFEADLWRFLQRMHELDAQHYDWDQSVSRDPQSDNFSYSIGGRGYYVVGLHPGADRSARRFVRPALVFNLHDQFERLRADGRYDTLSSAIVKRDERIEGSQNPMLKKFGTSSEARQYSGRVVDDQWKCPFRAR